MINNGRRQIEKFQPPASDGRLPGRPRPGPPVFSKPAVIVSAGLHLALVCLLVFGLPSCQENKSLIDPSQVMIVQLLEEARPTPTPPPTPPEAAPEPKPPAPAPTFELPLGESSRNLQRSGQAEAEAVEDLAPPAPPEERIALGPKAPAPPPELEKRRDRKPEVKAPEVQRRAEPTPRRREPDYSQVPQALYRTLGRDAGAIHFGDRRGRRADPVISRYFELMKIKLNENWRPPQGLSPRLQVGFAITIEPNGRISSVVLAQSSGFPDFDRAVERAIKMSSPLPPLPSVFGGRRFSDIIGFTPEGLGR